MIHKDEIQAMINAGLTVHFRRLLCASVMCVISILNATVSQAAEIPGFHKVVALSAKEQNAPDFIQALFSQLGIPVRLDTEVPGRVNGRFDGSAREVFEQIASTFNIHLYYDSSVAYVYRSDQISQKILPLSQERSQTLVKTANTLKLPDSKNTLSLIPAGGLIVSGNKRFIEQVAELSAAIQHNVKSVKTPKPRVVVREFKLKYATADDDSSVINGNEVVIPGVATMLREFINQDKSPSSVTVIRNNASNQSSDSYISGPVDRASGGQVSSDQNKTQSSGSKSSMVASIVAHPQTNSVWIQDTADRMPIYENMIAAMDQLPRMVEIEATIIDINSERQRELGVNWRAMNDGNEFLVGEGTFQDQLLRPDQIVTPQGNGGILSLVLGDRTKFIARMRALEELGAARIVSKPHVITRANVEAVLGSTTEFFVRLEGKDAVGLERQTFGTILRVTPRVFDTDTNSGISLLITIEDGSATEGEVDRIPGIERSIVSTQALVDEGQSLLLGGLVRESFRKGESKVPLLGDIPGIGRLFKSNTRNNTKTERLFLITPRISSQQGMDSSVNAPVLQGKMDDIIATSERRTATAFEAVEQKEADAQRRVRDSLPTGTTKPESKPAVMNRDRADDTVEMLDIQRMLVVPSLNRKRKSQTDLASVLVQTPELKSWRTKNWTNKDKGWQAVKSR